MSSLCAGGLEGLRVPADGCHCSKVGSTDYREGAPWHDSLTGFIPCLREQFFLFSTLWISAMISRKTVRYGTARIVTGRCEH